MTLESEEFIANEGNAAAVIEAIREHVKPTTLQLETDEEGGARVVVLPKGLSIHSLKRFEDERRERPIRREGTAELTTLRSFADHVNRFADRHTAVFAKDDRKAPELVAVLDYHEANRFSDDEGELEQEGEPRFGVHRSRYRFPLGDEWRAWTRFAEGGFHEQREFAAFLEDHLTDILDPSAAGDSIRDFASAHGLTLAGQSRLMELARGLEIRAGVKVTQVLNRQSGEARVAYEETHADAEGGPLKIPGGFAIAVSVFRNGAAYQIPVRLRYKRSGSSVQWAVALHRIDRVFDHAFDEACKEVEQTTGLPLFYGVPE